MNFKIILLGLQHVFAMFSGTVLVPYLMGIPISVALFTSGLGTLIFHSFTKFKIPVYLGSSFIYIAPVISVTSYYSSNGNTADAIAYATGGIMVAGLVKILFGLIIGWIGVKKVEKLFPPVITGTMIMLIGLSLANTVVHMASSNWALALVVIITITLVKLYTKGFVNLFPTILGISVGYVIAILTGMVDFSSVAGGIGIENVSWMGLPAFFLPKFSWYAIGIIVPAAIVASIEHIGDIYAVSMVTDRNFYDDPGINRSMIGDGIATSIAGLLGGPSNTTYSENTGVLVITGMYNPIIMRIAAVFAIILSFIPKVEAIINTIPASVIGGASIVLAGLIATTGIKTYIDNKVEINNKNIFIISLMLIPALGGASIQLGNFSLKGLGLSALIGILCNLILTHKNKHNCQ